MQKLTVQRFSTIKTQRCTNEDCPVYKMFSNQIRAKYYQLVFSIDKCCFDCYGFHTQADKRRKPFIKERQQQKLAYSQNYMLDFSSMMKKTGEKIQLFSQNKPNTQAKNDVLSNTCYNNVEHLYHPLVYKTMSCPFVKQNEKNQKQTLQSNFCCHIYCPFLHKNQTLDSQLQTKLKEYRKKNQQKLTDDNFLAQKKQFQDKIMNIVLLRTAKSINDLQKRQVNLKKHQQQSSNHSIIIQASEKDQISQTNNNNHSPNNTDKQQIQRIKQKLKQKVQKWTKIDKQNQLQQQSRKVVDKQPSIGGDKQNKNTIIMNKTKSTQQQIEKDSLGTTYNYFKYGEKLSLIESRTIQFKHFKDISDPNHIPLIMRYVTAFLNTQGGKLYIGVDDNSYVYGSRFKQSQYDKLLLNIDRQCRFCLNPPLLPQKYNIKLIPVYQQKKGQQKDNQRWVIEITVFPTKQSKKKLFLYNRECYMRMNASTHKLNASDIIEYISLNSSSHLEQATERQEDDRKIKEQSVSQNGSMTRQQVTFIQRQNQLINQNTNIQKTTKSCSKSKFQTQQSKTNQFQQQINKKSIQDLYLLKKDYEQKLMTIIQAYKKKQRQMR